MDNIENSNNNDILLAEDAIKQRRWSWKFLMPIVACVLSIILDVVLPDVNSLINVSTGYTVFRWVMMALIVVFVVLAIVAYGHRDYRVRWLHKVPFYTVLVLVLCLYNVITKKSELLEPIYFPTLDRIGTVFIEDHSILLTCTAYSMRLIVLGAGMGFLIGFIMGILIGWNQKAYYWLFPVVRFIGPMPTTIWIPLAMLLFPTLLRAALFIVGLSMWFPVTFLTSSGIQGVRKSLFEAGSTLGANTLYSIWHIAIPAAMPNIFTGIFMGMVSSLISLVSAELIGAKYGLGWFINWQQQVMSYPQVYAGFFIIALICFIIFRLVFSLRNRMLSWQKGAVRW